LIYVRRLSALHSRGDHFEIKFIENCYKFEIFLVKIGTYGLPKPFVGPTSPQVPALLLEPTGVTDQKSNMGVSMYPIQLSFSQIYKNFRDIVVYPTAQYEKKREIFGPKDIS